MTDQELNDLRDGFEARRDALFEADRGKPLVRAPKQPPLGPGRSAYIRGYSFSITEYATRCLWLGEQVEAANDALIENASAYLDDPPIIHDRDSFHWHSDTLLRLIEMYGSNGVIDAGRMTREAEKKCLDLCWEYCRPHSKLEDADYRASGTWDIHESENHHVQRFSTTWHYAKLAKDDPDYRDLEYDDGGSPLDHYRAWTDYTIAYCLERARKGLFVEMHNEGYNGVLLKGLYNCYDNGEAPLREQVGRLLDLYWATWAQEQIDGVEGGGRTRVYQGAGSLTHRDGTMARLTWLHMGSGKPGPIRCTVLSAALSAYRLPLVVMDLALDTPGRGIYEIHQRPLGLSVPGHKGMHPYRMQQDHGGIHRYSYCTPQFIIGTPMVEAQEREAWAAISSQNRWDGVILAGHPNARIVPQVEAENEKVCFNGSWSVQQKGTLISQKLRTSAGGGAMRVWFSSAGLTAPETAGTWTVVEHNGAYAAVRPARGSYTWETVEAEDRTVGGHSGLAKVTEHLPGGRWMVLADEWSPVILEVIRKEDVGDRDAFVNALGEPDFKGDTMTYVSVYGDTLTFDADQTHPPMVNGAPVDYAPATAFDSPFVKADWNSGRVWIHKGERELVLDFDENA